jgi:hypothetical protein
MAERDFDPVEQPNVPNIYGGTPEPPTPDIEIAEQNTLIERDDLGVGSFTLVNAGDPIPNGLRDLPRRAVDEDRPARRSRPKK